MTREGEEADRLWATIDYPARQVLLHLILAGGDATASALARDLPITRQGIAKHLAVLERAGLVEAALGVRSDPASGRTAWTKLLDGWRSSWRSGTSAYP